MTKAELVSAIAEKSGLNRVQAKDALDAFIDTITISAKVGTRRCASSASATSRSGGSAGGGGAQSAHG